MIRGSADEQRLDFGCAAANGAFEIHYNGDRPATLAASSPEHSLIFFLYALLHRLQNSLLVIVDQVEVLFEDFYFLIIPLLLDQEAIVIPDLDLGTLALYLFDQPLEFGIDHLHVFDPAELHLPEHLLAVVDEVHCPLAVLLKLSDNLLTILFEDVDTLFLLDKAVATVVDDAVYADEAHASIAEMLH